MLSSSRSQPPPAAGLVRHRLLDAFAAETGWRVGVVTAPAGSGKTTLLTHVASRFRGEVAWYRPRMTDRSDAVLSCIEHALAVVAEGVAHGWRSPEDVACALDTVTSQPLLLVVDGFERVAGCETVFEEFLECAPTRFSLLVAARRRPAFNLSQFRLDGSLVEIEMGDLRFRSWETERLFEDHYRDPLPLDALEELHARTGGWAAALALYQRAAHGGGTLERRALVSALGRRDGATRDYLRRNILDELEPRLRRFVIDASVLARVHRDVCAQLLDDADCGCLLDELERLQLCLPVPGRDGLMSWHPLLREHVLDELRASIGNADFDERVRRASALVEAAIDRGARTPPHGRRRPAGRSTRRRRWLFGLAAPLAPDPPRVRNADVTWSAVIREAAVGNPLEREREAADKSGPSWRLAAGVAALLAGHVREAATYLVEARDLGRDPRLVVMAQVAYAHCLLLAGETRRGAEQAERASDAAERLALPAVLRLARAATALTDREDGPAEAAWARRSARRDGDVWGENLISLVDGWGALRVGANATPALEEAVLGFRRLGAAVLESWARSALAVAEARAAAPLSPDLAAQAEACARTVQTRGGEALAYLALADLPIADATAYRQLARSIGRECGLALPFCGGATGDADAGAPSRRVSIRCFGQFEISRDRRTIELQAAKPQVRRLMRLLAIHVPAPVHREVIMEALWPAAPADAARRNLHVCVSSLRRTLEREGIMCEITREGQAYRLALPPDARVDVVEFDGAMRAGRRARAPEDVIDAFGRAFDLYSGDLLVEEGPAEWVVHERERRRDEACEAAQALARALLATGEPASAARVCDRGVRLDRYSDALWRLRISACVAAGDVAAADRARRDYEAVLRSLEPAVVVP